MVFCSSFPILFLLPICLNLLGTPASKNYEGGFSCALMSKDLGCANGFLHFTVLTDLHLMF